MEDVVRGYEDQIVRLNTQFNQQLDIINKQESILDCYDVKLSEAKNEIDKLIGEIKLIWES